MKVKQIHAAPALLIIVFLLNFGVTLLPENVIDTESDPYISAAMLQLFIITLPALIFCRLRGGGYMKGLRLRMFGASHIGFITFASMLLFFGNCGINFLMHFLFPGAGAGTAVSDPGGITGGLYLILTMAIIPAVTEEFLFRGIIVREYESVGVCPAVFMSALTFAMLHFSFIGLPAYFFSGFVLAMVVYTTRSIFAAMIVHAVNNTASIFFGELIYKVVSRQGTILFCFVLITLILISAVMTFGESERIYKSYGQNGESSDYVGKRKRRSGITGILISIFSPMFAALAVLYIIISAINR